ncbi:RagB/SusD family nutrient uptake outer membrane protein [Marinilabilia salmonicolor]|uniref:Putative outer membrane starch-binding protein n=1 Tax=Marinilabilia salmonicolor TaxID=989 RepID=A0A368UU58_9BACT|nr:RagB/SusD family nutrient uptake outer membrane protein [Marinilabilia salmonicolor]RCW30411.1 putative outer membrane starch-binding protein [Marinilabilia salmonicolor]
MKRKYIIKSLVFMMALFFTMPSCTKLENENFSEFIAEDFTPTESDLPRITRAAYGDWRKVLLLWDGYWRVQEVSADQVVIPARPNGWVDGGVHKRIFMHTWLPSDPIVNETWYRSYAGINNCNRVMFQLESLLDEEEAAPAIAELRALRASYYYVLCDVYGNVPIVTDFDVPDGYLPEQNTRKEVYDFVVKELEESIPYLTEENNSETYGRFNEWAARTLLAKVYLNAEVWSGTPQWDKCIAQCDSVILSNKYSLEPDQKNVFVTENQNSNEIIYGISIDENYTTDWNAFDIHMQTLQPSNQATFDMTHTPWGGMCAVPQFIETFDSEDKRLINNFIYGQQYSSSGDMLYCTMGDLAGEPLAYINEIPSIDASQEIHGFRFGKFEIAMGASNILNNDFPLFRYADILMMKAECLLRTGYSDEAAQIVTQIRERAFPVTSGKAAVTGDELLQGSVYDYGVRDNNSTTFEGGGDIPYGRFLDELGWEFNQEGRRRQDLIRFGVFAEKSWFSHSPEGDYRELFPIPLNVMDTNSKLQQNPGY